MTEDFELMRERLAENNDVLGPHKFLRDFRAEAARAKEHVIAQAMGIDPDEVGEEIYKIFDGVSKNVHKELYIDSWSQMVHGDRIHAWDETLFPEQAREMKKRQDDFFERFRALGVDVHFTNPPKNKIVKFFPFVGRNHIKGVNIDGKIFYSGTFNFTDSHIERGDFMVKSTGPVAKKLSDAFAKLHAGQIEKDSQIPLDEYSDLLIDSGKPGESIILNRAANLVSHAEESVENASVFLPDGPLSKAFAAAQKRGVRTQVVTSGVPHKNWGLNVDSVMHLVNIVNRARNFLSRNKVEVLETPFRGVHAKLLIVDGKHAYFGSHNLAESGVKAGTKEWGIFTSDPKLVKQLRIQYMNLKGETDPKLEQVL